MAYYVKLAQEALPPAPWAHNPLPDGVPLYHSLLPAEEKEKLESYFYPQWQQAELYYNQAGNAVLLVPLHRPLSVFYFTAFRRRLRVEFDRHKQIVSTHIVELATDKETLINQGNRLLIEASSYTGAFTGSLFLYDMNYHLLQKLEGKPHGKFSEEKAYQIVRNITTDDPGDPGCIATVTCNGTTWCKISESGTWISSKGVVEIASPDSDPCNNNGGGGASGSAGGSTGGGSGGYYGGNWGGIFIGGGSGGGSGSGTPGWQDGIEVPPMDPGDTHPQIPPIKNPDNPLPGNPVDFGPFTPTEAFLNKPGLQALWQQMMEVPEFQALIHDLESDYITYKLDIASHPEQPQNGEKLGGFTQVSFKNGKWEITVALTPELFTPQPTKALVAHSIVHEAAHAKIFKDFIEATNGQSADDPSLLPDNHYLKNAYQTYDPSNFSEYEDIESNTRSHVHHCLIALQYRDLMAQVMWVIDEDNGQRSPNYPNPLTMQDYLLAAWAGLHHTALFMMEVKQSQDTYDWYQGAIQFILYYSNVKL
ncbi:hypothetical protein [Thermonema rossianum]|uniref:hypothetical protein n=1 Tax=Thermonema rossianum TaxID=55505 RepID=UPI00056F5E06|nr:hypothetical protein [Thermonema rossianum]